MKIIAWNVNSLRAIIKTDNLKLLIDDEDPDILCFSETKLSNLDIDEYFIKNYHQYKYRYWHNSKKRPGYSGTAIIMKYKPLNVSFGLYYNNENIDDEGRVITIQLKKNLTLIHLYNINAGIGLNRLYYKVNIWDRILEQYIITIQKSIKNVIICGDINVAHHKIDIKNPNNLKTAGFTIEERQSYSQLLEQCMLLDVFRFLYSKSIKYTFWSYRNNSRNKGIGWRLDVYLINKSFINKIKDCKILDSYLGSDHCPISLIIK